MLGTTESVKLYGGLEPCSRIIQASLTFSGLYSRTFSTKPWAVGSPIDLDFSVPGVSISVLLTKLDFTGGSAGNELELAITFQLCQTLLSRTCTNLFSFPGSFQSVGLSSPLVLPITSAAVCPLASSSMSTAMIAGIAIGALVGIGLIGMVLAALYQRHQAANRVNEGSAASQFRNDQFADLNRPFGETSARESRRKLSVGGGSGMMVNHISLQNLNSTGNLHGEPPEGFASMLAGDTNAEMHA
jgi:hypothetical protein